MGYEELIESLRKEGREKIHDILKKTEAEAEQLKQDAATHIDKLKKEFKKKEAALIQSLKNEAITNAERRAHELKLSETTLLSERLFTLSKALLPGLRDTSYPDTFSALVNELPSAEWERVKVNPSDTALAAGHFPGAEVVQDSKVSGGLEVFQDKGRIHIINTFEKRLERGWADILPMLLNDIEKELG